MDSAPQSLTVVSAPYSPPIVCVRDGRGVGNRGALKTRHRANVLSVRSRGHNVDDCLATGRGAARAHNGHTVNVDAYSRVFLLANAQSHVVCFTVAARTASDLDQSIVSEHTPECNALSPTVVGCSRSSEVYDPTVHADANIGLTLLDLSDRTKALGSSELVLRAVSCSWGGPSSLTTTFFRYLGLVSKPHAVFFPPDSVSETKASRLPLFQAMIGKAAGSGQSFLSYRAGSSFAVAAERADWICMSISASASEFPKCYDYKQMPRCQCGRMPDSPCGGNAAGQNCEIAAAARECAVDAACNLAAAGGCCTPSHVLASNGKNKTAVSSSRARSPTCSSLYVQDLAISERLCCVVGIDS